MKLPSRILKASIGITCVACVAACGGGGGGGSPVAAAPQSTAALTNIALVENRAGVVPTATTVDANLQNAWGLAFAPGGAFWIADNNNSVSSLYDGKGATQSLVVTMPNGAVGPSNPSGEVYNATADFAISSGGAPALFLFDGEGGTIVGWAGTSGASAAILYDDGVMNPSSPAVYKGLALANNGTANFLYATDLHNAKVDVFDANFNKISAGSGLFAGKFSDPSIPAGFAPFGITLVGSQLFITYAEQNVGARDEITGAGLGYVNVFDLNGNLLRRFASAGALNAPWGIALAPAGFGSVGGALLVGNFGDGRVNSFNPTSGADLGAVTLASGQALVIPGLWALVFGNGAQNAPANALFYTAGPNSQLDGVFGRIDSSTGMSTPAPAPGY